ncbi:MAG TPA: GNAT family N-acetyltransferase [Thermoanaerobaculia bacterium]
MIFLQESSGIRYGVFELSDQEEMTSLLAEAFSQYDPPAAAMGVTAGEFAPMVRPYGPGTAAEGLTVVARSAATGEMVGAVLATDFTAPPPAGGEQGSEKFLPVFTLIDQLDAQYQQDKAIEPGTDLHILLLGVARSFTGRQVAQRLVAACEENARRKGYRRAVTEASGSVSQHVFRKLGYAERSQISYQEYRYEGAPVFASIEGHSGMILMDKALD